MTAIRMLVGTIRLHPWSSAQDATLLAAVMLVGVLLALEYDIVVFWDDFSGPQRRIRVEEMFALTLLLGLGIFVFVLRRLQEHRRDFAERLRAEVEVGEYRTLALEDPLTSLPNRRAIMTALEAAIGQAPDGTRPLAYYLLDLNGFKRINDEHGHAIGDEVLRAVAQRLRAAARRPDVVARLGGDEFAALACGIEDRNEASEIGQRFLAALSKPIRVGDCTLAVGVAVGVAICPADGTTGQQIMHHADLAMYRAKAADRSTLRFFEAAARGRVAPEPSRTASA